MTFGQSTGIGNQPVTNLVSESGIGQAGTTKFAIEAIRFKARAARV